MILYDGDHTHVVCGKLQVDVLPGCIDVQYIFTLRKFEMIIKCGLLCELNVI